jgi:hypothetical protein
MNLVWSDLASFPPPLSGYPLSTVATKGSGLFKCVNPTLHLSSLEPENRDYFVESLYAYATADQLCTAAARA